MRREKHFTAKSAARVVAYARRDGASDKELLKYIISAYGLNNVSCLISQSLMILTNKVFADSILIALFGMLGILKGFKILTEGKISSLTILPVEHFIRLYMPTLSSYYGALVMWTGMSLTYTSSLIAFFDVFIDQSEYYFFLDEVCSSESDANPYPISPPPPNFDLFYNENELEKSQLERYGGLFNTIFPDSTI